MVDKGLVNQLLDALEDLLIDNNAYRTALTTLDKYLPPQARHLADQMITAAKADPKLREMLHGQLLRFAINLQNKRWRDF